MDGRHLPSLNTQVPGPQSRAWVDRLAERECPAITVRRGRRAAVLAVEADDPIVWDRAIGANVQDVDGNVFVDLTAGFGVASVGHAHPAVVAAGQAQLAHLPHAMGDAFPDRRRIELLERLAELTGLDSAILGSSGADAVEAALKTARMATGRDGVIAFESGYHGLSYGALSVTDYHADAFRGPFVGQLGDHVRHAPFGGPIPDLSDVGAVIVEPIQGRGGIVVPPAGWLSELSSATRNAGAVLILDEIFTGFGRTGAWFAFQDEGVRPDLLCVGKGMAGGFPISACLGTEAVMAGWGVPTGEALHTQTFLGNPVGCAMALACIEEIAEVLPTVHERGAWLTAEISRRGWPVRGRGLALGVSVPDALRVSRALLQRGYIALPAGPQAEVLSLSPPLNITQHLLEGFLDALQAVTARG